LHAFVFAAFFMKWQQITYLLTFKCVAKIQCCDISATNQKTMHKNTGTNTEQTNDTLYI